jgi:hypothetical protein
MKNLNRPTQVRACVELIDHCNTHVPREFIIALAGGLVRSTKSIQLRKNGKSFYVTNEIDGSHQTLSAKSLYTRCNIGEAMDKGAFYLSA